MNNNTRNFTRSSQMTTQFLLELLKEASKYKATKTYPDLSGKLLGNIFFNPSLRTKLSFEAAMARSGGQALSMTSGGSGWAFESQLGVRMDSDKPEHLKEAVRVISRYVDAIGVRSFAKMESLEEDEQERILSAFEEFATVPVISLESAMEHPCQMLADMLTIREAVGEDLTKKRFCLRWAPHTKGLPLAVPHSALLGASHLGMEITIAAPNEYQLSEKYMSEARRITAQTGGTISFITEPDQIPDSTDILYVKSWGATKWYGKAGKQQEELRRLSPWIVRDSNPALRKGATLMHCLPVRRNVVIEDKALDHKNSKIIDQAENRLWAELAVLNWIFNNK